MIAAAIPDAAKGPAEQAREIVQKFGHDMSELPRSKDMADRLAAIGRGGRVPALSVRQRMRQ